MTFSILAISDDKSEIGIAVQSKFPGVATNAIFGKGSVGVVATQGFSNPDHAEMAFNLLEKGQSPSEVIEIIRKDDPDETQRQLAILSTTGECAAYSGEELT